MLPELYHETYLMFRGRFTAKLDQMMCHADITNEQLGKKKKKWRGKN